MATAAAAAVAVSDPEPKALLCFANSIRKKSRMLLERAADSESRIAATYESL
jgi:hypothetical protein